MKTTNDQIKQHLLSTLERKEKYIEIIKMLTDDQDSDIMNLLFSKTLQCERDIKGFYVYLNEIENHDA